MKTCTSCNSQNQNDAVYCENCGTPLKKKILRNPLVLGFLGLLALFVIGFFIFKSLGKSDVKESIAKGKDEYFSIKTNGVVKIGSQSDAPPLNYVEEGKRLGLDYELAKLIFNQSQFGFFNENAINADRQVEEYGDVTSLLKQKNSRGEYLVDMIMGGLTYMDGDDPEIIYSIPYLDNFGYCLVSLKSDHFKSLDDLKNKKIGVVNGDVDVLEYVKRVLPAGAKVIELSDESDLWLSENINGKMCDAIVYDFPFAAIEVEETNLEIKVAKLPDSDIAYKIGIRKGNDRLKEELDNAIRKVKELPEYADLLRKYLPTSNVAKVKNENNLPTHKILKGETLSLIAKTKLGSMERWKDIQTLNNLPNPNLIEVGQMLIMPEDYKK